MDMTNHTRLDLVEGGSIFKQGEHAQLAFNPRDYSGKTVDLTGKNIAVAIWNSKGIMYEGAASFDSTAQLIRLTINQLLQHGDFQIEFTVTDAADPDYRRKFPSGEYEGKIYIKPSADNIDFIGVSMTTVAQLRTEQEEKQQQFELAIVPQVDELKQRVEEGIGAFTEDTEVKDARMNEINLRAFNEKTIALLAETGERVKDLSVSLQKTAQKKSLKIITQGTSMTYGYDTVSADKRPAPSTLTDNGVAHTVTRAGVTYPEKLQQNLREVYGHEGITVINKGYSGDWASLSYERWGNNENADIAFIELGTNDSDMSKTNTKQTAGDISAYLDWMRKLISRYTSWGTSVILLTPPRIRTPEDPTTTTGHITNTFRFALNQLATEMNCPIIDTEEFSNGWDNTYYSDGVHFNTKGYSAFADRLTSILIGYGYKNSLYAGKTLSIRPTRDNIVLKGANVYGAANSPAPTESVATTASGLVMGLAAGTSAYYSFYAEQDNLILIPIHTVYSGSRAQYILDFGSEQGSVPLLHSVRKTIPHTKPTSDITSARHTFDLDLFLNNLDYSNTTDYLHIANKGWHNVRITNPASGAAQFYGFVVMSYDDFRQKDVVRWTDFTPVIKGATVAGTHTYTLQGGKYRYDKKSKTTHVQLIVDCTLDDTIDGNLFISVPLDASSRPLNISAPLNVSDIRGLRADASPIYASFAANSTDIFLQYLATSGNTGYIAGSGLRGKRVSIAISGSFMSS